MSVLFRAWKPSPQGKDPEIQRLEKEAEETRQKIAALREQGRQRRAHRLQSLDALETRRMTLQEILKRMDKELADKDVDDYADVLAEAFGERKIFAHRAIGLEALLCQFMHQMLAKQHQLKIMKRSGKDLQKLYQSNKNQNREEFHSFEALAVHLETMRLSLEAQYDDIFAAQHSLLARLHHVEAGGTMTNYKIVKPAPVAKPKKQPKLSVSKKHFVSPKNLVTSSNDTVESDEDDTMMQDILTVKEEEESWAPPSKQLQDINLNADASKSSGLGSPGERRSSGRKSSSDTVSKSARDRRREIEQKRLASGRGRIGISSNVFEETDKDKAREKLRELEAKRASLNDSELRERSSRRSSRPTSRSPSDASSKTKSRSPTSKKESSDHSLSPPREDTNLTPSEMRREKRKNERASARASTTTNS